MSEPVAKRDREDERLNHLRVNEVASELIERTKAEIVAIEIGIGLTSKPRFVRVATQITEVLREHECVFLFRT